MGKISKHIVLVPLPAQGHLLPIFYLARKLAAHGFSVTIINIDSIHDSVKQSWKHAPRQDIRLESVRMELKVPKGFGKDNLDAVSVFVDSLEALEEPLADLLTKLNAAQPVSCVISDFYHPSAPYAASSAGIPSVCFWSGTASWASIHYSLPSLIEAGYVPIRESNSEEIVHLPGLQPMKADLLPIYLHEDFYQKMGDKRFLRQLERTEKDTWILANSFYELEPEASEAMHDVVTAKFTSIGPLFPLKNGNNNSDMEASLRPEDRDSLHWLDNQPPKSVLYVAFGSITVLTRGEFEQLFEGLEASKHPFLLVVPPELVPDLAEDRLEELTSTAARSGKGMLVKWAPQLAVLQHGSVGGFLTHCGWNSILESLSSGVPMLGWPQASEQNTNCKLFLEDLETGMELKDRSSEGVARAVRELMSNKKLKRNAVEAGRKARAAAAPGGSSHRNLIDFFESNLVEDV